MLRKGMRKVNNSVCLEHHGETVDGKAHAKLPGIHLH